MLIGTGPTVTLSAIRLVPYSERSIFLLLAGEKALEVFGILRRPDGYLDS